MNYMVQTPEVAAGDLPPVIVFGTDAWSEVWQTRQQIVSRLVGRGWPTVYSCGAFYTWDRFRLDWSAASWRDRVEILDGVTVYWPGRWQMRWPKLPIWDRTVLGAHADNLIEKADVPADLAPIPRPRMGYVGRINRKLDIALIATLAKAAPHQPGNAERTMERPVAAR